MAKTMKSIVLLLVFILIAVSFSSCRVTRTVMPEGFQNLIDDFDVMPVEIRLVQYIVFQNTLEIELQLNSDNITREDISQLLNVMSAYFRTEQFAMFIDDVQEIDDGYFSIALYIFNADGENIFILGTLARENFGNWGSGFGDMEQP